MFRGVERVAVHTQDDGRVTRSGLSTQRRAHNHVLGAGRKMGARLLDSAKDSCGLDHYVHAELLPRELGRIAFAEDGKLVPIHHQLVALRLDSASQRPVVGVILQQVGVDIQRSEVIDRHHVHAFALALDQRPQCQAPNPPEAVDRDFHGHAESSSCPGSSVHLLGKPGVTRNPPLRSSLPEGRRAVPSRPLVGRILAKRTGRVKDEQAGSAHRLYRTGPPDAAPADSVLRLAPA